MRRVLKSEQFLLLTDTDRVNLLLLLLLHPPKFSWCHICSSPYGALPLKTMDIALACLTLFSAVLNNSEAGTLSLSWVILTHCFPARRCFLPGPFYRMLSLYYELKELIFLISNNVVKILCFLFFMKFRISLSFQM